MSIQSRGSGTRDVPDEDLMTRYVHGDDGAFNELFRRYESRIYGYFLKRTRSPQRAQDLYQEVFLRIHRGRQQYDRGRPLAPWLFQIANRLLIDDQRRAFRSREVPLADPSREVSANRTDFEVRMSDREKIARLLDDLSPAEQHVLLSTRVDGIGYTELSTQVGKSIDALKKMVSRAAKRMRTMEDLERALPMGRR